MAACAHASAARAPGQAGRRARTPPRRRPLRALHPAARPHPAGEVFLRRGARAGGRGQQRDRGAQPRRAPERHAAGGRDPRLRASLRRALLPVVTAANPGLEEIELVLTDRLVDLVDDRIDLALRMTARPPRMRSRATGCACAGCSARRAPMSSATAAARAGRLAQHALSAARDRRRPWGLVAAAGAQARVRCAARPFRQPRLRSTRSSPATASPSCPPYLCEPALQATACAPCSTAGEPAFDVGRDLYACYTPGRVGVSRCASSWMRCSSGCSTLPNREPAPRGGRMRKAVKASRRRWRAGAGGRRIRAVDRAPEALQHPLPARI